MVKAYQQIPRRRPQNVYRGSRKRPVSWLVKLLVSLLTFAAACVVILVAMLWYYGRDLPTVESLRGFAPTQITHVYDRHDRLIGELFDERRTVVPLSKVPRVVVLAVLAAEDADFYRHEGLDYPGIVRALYRDIVSGQPRQGASTITQQVVKNLLLTHERTIRRKIKELILTRRLEQELEKDEILHLYINNIYFGHGRYGIQEAARYYFDKDVGQLNLAEASLIAGVPQAPSRLSPRSHPEAAKARQTFVLSQLERKRESYWPDLSLAEIDGARKEEVKLSRLQEAQDAAPELMQQVRKELAKLVGDEDARKGGYRVTTTVDIELQAKVRAELQTGLRAYDQRHGLRPPYRARRTRRTRGAAKDLQAGRAYLATVVNADDVRGTLFLDINGHPAVLDLAAESRYNPKNLAASRFASKNAELAVFVDTVAKDEAAPEEHAKSHTNSLRSPAQARLAVGPQGAAIIMHPETRDVLALVGGYHDAPGFDRATQAVRQPGSAFKPIVYAYAIKSRAFTPASLVLDAPEVFDKYQPQNFETWSFEGAVRLRYALAKSINLVAIRLIEQLGPDNVVGFAASLGMTTALEPTLPLALGASGVIPLELANAYATFAAAGIWSAPRFISKVLAADGKEIPLSGQEAKQVITPAEAFVMTSMLTSVVAHGTGSAALALGKTVAGKTGTSNRARDVWFVGYTPHVLGAVWIGYDDNRSLGRGESGGSTALPVWMNLIKAAEQGKPSGTFAMPPGVERVRIDPESGKLAFEGMPNAIEEVFVEGTVPKEAVLDPSLTDTKTFLMEQSSEAVEENSQ
jgi:penicillin-binding protein 1A